MAKAVHVELARVVDRDRLLFSLRSRGVEAEPVDHDGRCAVVLEREGAELDDVVDGWLAETGAPLVPEWVSETTVFLRPAGD